MSECGSFEEKSRTLQQLIMNKLWQVKKRNFKGKKKVDYDHELFMQHRTSPCCLPRRDPRQLVSRVEDSTGCEGVGRAGVGHAFTGVVRSCKSHKHNH